MSSAPDPGGPTWGGQPAGGQYQPPGPPPQQGSNGVAIAALVLGLLSIPLALFIFGGLLGIAAVILGIVGISKARQLGGTGQGMAITGIVSGALGALLAILALTVLSASLNFLDSPEGQEVLSEIEASVSEIEAGNE
jgi:hypothetical protein